MPVWAITLLLNVLQNELLTDAHLKAWKAALCAELKAMEATAILPLEASAIDALVKFLQA